MDNTNYMDDKQKKKLVMKVSWVSITVNIVLSIFKIAAGLVSGSGAMISDGVHSASDVFSTFVVIFGYNASQKESDKGHPYGHERLECVAAIILASILAFVGLEIGISGIQKIISGVSDGGLTVPGVLALWAAVFSIVVKEWMFWYTRHAAKKIDSGALMADAWHHRSDAFSSIGSLIGIGGAMLGFPVMDSVASVVIYIFIVKVAYDISKDALIKMLDTSCRRDYEKKLTEDILTQEGVLGVDMLRTRMFGNKVYIDLEISVDGNQSLREAHDVAERVHKSVEQRFSDVKHIMIHVNPSNFAMN